MNMVSIESTHLGQQSSYPKHYDPSVLVAVPRSINRETYGIKNDSLPFDGVDVWHAYEFGFLTGKGAPVVGVLKIIYPATSSFLVESKSLKLYLNSFNMDKFGKKKEEGIEEVLEIIRIDLSELLQCKVELNYFDHRLQPGKFDFDGYALVEESINFDQFVCNHYREDINLLEESGLQGKICWGTNLLRSNCKITGQPDWGSLYIEMEGEKLPTPESFLKYIVSLRNENHFHEEICEMVFKRIQDIFQPLQLMVTCLYTRRGGIDICPVRYTGNKAELLITNIKLADKPSFRQ